MQVNITEESPILRTLEITVEADRVEKAFSKAFKEALRHLALPGFRRGKVPAYMGRKHIPNQVLNGQVAEEVIPEAYAEALEQENLRPVSRPNYKVDKIERGEDLVFKVSFEVIPHVEMKDYKGIEITQARYEVSEDDINSAIERTRAGRAELVDVTEERGLKEGDIAYVDFESFEGEDKKPMENGASKNFPMELEPSRFVPGFLDNLYGKKRGEEAHFDVDFPEDYAPNMAGKHVHFDFTINDIKERRLPELDDEFAKSVSEFDTMDALRNNIKEFMTKQVQANADQGVAEKVYLKISEQVPPEMVPAGLVQYHAAVHAQHMQQEMAYNHQTPEAWLKAHNLTVEAWQQRITGIGFGEARMEIIVRAIADAENIEVSEEEMEEVVAEESKRMQQSQAYVWNRMEKSGTLDLLRYSILRDKVTKMLIEASKVTYCTPEEAAAAAKAEAEAKKCCDCAEGEKKDDCDCKCHDEKCCDCEGEKKEGCECECHDK